jgi:hypothetical protein
MRDEFVKADSLTMHSNDSSGQSLFNCEVLVGTAFATIALGVFSLGRSTLA